MFCPECGAKNLEEARFCESCGAALGPQPKAQAPVEKPLPKKSEPEKTAPIVKEKKGLPKFVLLALAGLLGIILIAAGVFIFLRQMPKVVQVLKNFKVRVIAGPQVREKLTQVIPPKVEVIPPKIQVIAPEAQVVSPKVEVTPPRIDLRSGSVEDLCAAGEEAFKNGDLTNALSYFNASLQKNSAYARAYVGRGYTYSWQGDYDSAIADYWEAMSLMQDAASLVKLRHYLCDILIITNRLTEADSVLKALLGQQQPDAWSYALAGEYYLQKGDLSSAKKYFAEAVKLNPQEGNLRYDEAGRWVDKGQYTRALLLYDAAGLLKPNNSGVHFGRGNAYAGLGQKQEAIAAYERYLQFDSASEWAQKARERIVNLQKK